MGRKQILPRGLQNLAPRDLQVSRDIFRRGKTLPSSYFWLLAHALPLIWLQLGLCRPIKNIRFISGRGKSGGRRCQSPERSGAGGGGSEHGAVLGVCAGQSCTSGIDRRSRAELKTSR